MVCSTAPVWSSRTLTVPLPRLATKTWPVVVSTAAGSVPTRMVRTTRPVLASSMLTVPLPLLATKTWLVVSSTTRAVGWRPTAMVRSTAPVLVSSRLTLSLAVLATKTRLRRWPEYRPTALGLRPTALVCSTLPVVVSRKLTVLPAWLTTRARPSLLSTATVIGSLPTATVRSTALVALLSMVTVLLARLTTKAWPALLSISTAAGSRPTPTVRTRGPALPLVDWCWAARPRLAPGTLSVLPRLTTKVQAPNRTRTTSGSRAAHPDSPRNHTGCRRATYVKRAGPTREGLTVCSLPSSRPRKSRRWRWGLPVVSRAFGATCTVIGS